MQTQSFSVDALKSILTKLGVNSVQNYILTLGRNLSGLKQTPTKHNMSSILDFGKEVLQYIIDTKLVSKESKGNSRVINIVPNITLDSMIDSVKRTYPIRTVTSSKLKRDEILHSVEIASIGKSNSDLLKQQNNIPLLVRASNLKGSKRLPKNVTNASNPNYMLETKLVNSFIKDYDERVIFMNHSFDRRGRLYTMSYPLSFQSDEYTRSCFEFAYKQIVNDSGLLALKQDIANLGGLDKYTHSRKLEWFSENESNIIKIARLGKIDRRLSFCKDLDKPIRFYSACKAYLDAIEGKPIGYMCSIDSTASGSQIMSLLTRDTLSAKYTNLTSEDRRYDIYSEVAREYYKLLGETNPLKYLSDRKRFKESVMISGYNGKVKVEENFPNEKDRERFYQALDSVCKGASEIQELFNQAYLDNSDKPYMAWMMPDGFQCVVPQFKAKWHRITSKDFECMFKYEIIEPDVKTNKRSLSVNGIHSIDAFICRELLRRLGQEDIEIMSVHDSFYTHPNHIPRVLSCYNEILQDINTLKYDLVGSFLTDIYGKKMSNPFSSRQELNDIREARYSLC